MTKLSNDILDTYLGALDSMPFDKKFHFASRLYLWSGDVRFRELLESYKSEFSHNNNPKLALEFLVEQSKITNSHGSKNASELREPYFKKYPQLKLAIVLLFRITFLKNIYDINCTELLFEHIPKSDLENMKKELLNDPEAIAILSTHAVNFIYLYEKIINNNEEVNLDIFFNAAKYYDLTNKVHVQLLIYLYTHCVIGESLFYYRNISTERRKPYEKMILDLEEIINNRFTDINLDNKFEFLVCAKIVGYKSYLETKIYDEANISVSELGNFIIDKHNNNPQTNNIDIASSEHRNVLFIMSNLSFKPMN